MIHTPIEVDACGHEVSVSIMHLLHVQNYKLAMHAQLYIHSGLFMVLGI